MCNFELQIYSLHLRGRKISEFKFKNKFDINLLASPINKKLAAPMIDFFNIGMRVLQREKAQKSTPELRSFRTIFGAVHTICSKLRLKLHPVYPKILNRITYYVDCRS